MKNDLRGKAVLITGGTRGIGLETGLAFGRHGAICTLTHKWGSADEAAIRDAFACVGAPFPNIVQADVASDEDTASLIAGLRRQHEAIEVFVSNVAFGQTTETLPDYARRALHTTINYTAWPLVAYSQSIREEFGRAPRYVIGLSSAGPDSYITNYDLVACAKAVLETLGRYLAHHLRSEGTRVNILRAGMVRTESLAATLGPGRIAELEAAFPSAFLEPAAVAEVVLALCSGFMDAVSGQVITVDNGWAFSANPLSLHQPGRHA
jgi:NAD(P)-dependent dehydrogenase (short-subunit alcohol dehydrogenase family)